MSDPGIADGDLLARARRRRVLVIGGGVSGLVAALECAKVGLPVTVVEAADRVGGAIRVAELDGLTLDVGAESFATRGGTVRSLVDELGLSDRVVTPAGGRAWVTGLPGAAPLPAGGILGIPENPWAADVRRVIGWTGAWRAYLDRLRPPLTIGHQHSLGELVRRRMGERVLDRLVAPVVSGVYSARPDDIDVDLAAPGLNAALTRIGSLAGAVQVVRGDRDPSAPGSAVAGLAGGMSVLTDALAERIRELGGEVRTGVTATALSRAEAGWRARMRDPEREWEDEVDAVLVALPEGPARELLSAEVPLPGGSSEPAPVVDVVTLVVDSAELDSAPRGSGVLAVPGTSQAKALTHTTAKWAWVRDEAGRRAPHRHVVRVSFGTQGEAPATASMEQPQAADLARSEAAAMLGLPVDALALVAAHRERYVQTQPASALGQSERMRAVREAGHRADGLGIVGAWVAGTGLAQVVPDAIEEAEHVRRWLLWGDQAQA